MIQNMFDYVGYFVQIYDMYTLTTKLAKWESNFSGGLCCTYRANMRNRSQALREIQIINWHMGCLNRGTRSDHNKLFTWSRIPDLFGRSLIWRLWCRATCLKDPMVPEAKTHIPGLWREHSSCDFLLTGNQKRCLLAVGFRECPAGYFPRWRPQFLFEDIWGCGAFPLLRFSWASSSIKLSRLHPRFLHIRLSVWPCNPTQGCFRHTLCHSRSVSNHLQAFGIHISWYSLWSPIGFSKDPGLLAFFARWHHLVEGRWRGTTLGSFDHQSGHWTNTSVHFRVVSSVRPWNTLSPPAKSAW